MKSIPNITDKEVVVNILINQKTEYYKLVVILSKQNKYIEAEKIRKKAKKLSGKIDVILGKLMEEWVIDTTAMLNDLTKINNDIKESIDEIKKALKVAENVVTILKNIDKGIEAALKIISCI